MASVSLGIVGLSIFYTLYSGLILFTKNSAMNVSHQEARIALYQMLKDIHSSVSVPTLTDSNGLMVTGTGPAAGVEFQKMVSPTQYCQVTSNASAGQNVVVVTLPTGYPTPYAGANATGYGGMRLIIPSVQCEANLTSVSLSGRVATCTLEKNLPYQIDASDGAGTYNVPCFFTQRVCYYVTGPPDTYVNGVDVYSPPLQLRYIGIAQTATYALASTDLSSRTPFSIPSYGGTVDYQEVLISGLSAQDPQTTALNSICGFSVSSIMLTGTVPSYSPSSSIISGT